MSNPLEPLLVAVNKMEKRQRTVELSFTLMMVRLQELVPEKERASFDEHMEQMLQTLVKHGSPIMQMLDVVEKASEFTEH